MDVVYCGICNVRHEGSEDNTGGNYICVVCASNAASSSSSSIPPSSLALSGTLLSLLYEEAAYTDSYIEGILRGQRLLK